MNVLVGSLIEYKTTEYIINGSKITIHDLSSNEARQKRLETACSRFMEKAFEQKKRDLLQQAPVQKSNERTSFI